MRTLTLMAGILAASLSHGVMAAPVGALSQAATAEADAAGIPLVVVRFNQRKVYFEQPLYNAVAKAVDIKPSVTFELVSYVPANASAQAGKAAESQITQVADALVKMGIPKRRLQLITERTPEVKHHEVHVFVY